MAFNKFLLFYTFPCDGISATARTMKTTTIIAAGCTFILLGEFVLFPYLLTPIDEHTHHEQEAHIIYRIENFSTNHSHLNFP